MTRLIIDGNGVVCRLWWSNASGVPGRFARLVAELARENEAEAYVAWDSKGPTWRHELYPAYKRGRPVKPEGLGHDLAACRRLPQFAHVQTPGYEADDLIGTLARATVAAGEWALVLTRDKDMAQLVGPLCVMLDGSGGVLDEAGVKRKFGVPPDRIRHLLSWMGDASDGLPGVRGIGPVKAIPKALAGEIGDELTYELTALADVPLANGVDA